LDSGLGVEEKCVTSTASGFMGFALLFGFVARLAASLFLFFFGK
jgi:hypothetical protein